MHEAGVRGAGSVVSAGRLEGLDVAGVLRDAEVVTRAEVVEIRALARPQLREELLHELRRAPDVTWVHGDGGDADDERLPQA